MAIISTAQKYGDFETLYGKKYSNNSPDYLFCTQSKELTLDSKVDLFPILNNEPMTAPQNLQLWLIIQ